jgi:Cu-processing system permease protein
VTGVWIMAGVTFREAARKKLLWIAFLAGCAFLALFSTGLHFQVKALASATLPAPIIRQQLISALMQVGFYSVDLLAVVMTILTSVDTISGEIASGTIQAIATKPIGRWQILIGKWIGFAGMIAAYIAVMFGGVALVGLWIAATTPRHAFRGGSLIFLECLLLLTITFCSGTKFSTLTNGVIALGLHGIAFIGGWLEQIGAAANVPRLVTVGVVSSLIMPSEALWRRASFEMQPLFSRVLQLTPFANASAPSGAMVVYAVGYLVITLCLALYYFHRRDL